MAGVCEGECIERIPVDESLTLTSFHSSGLPQVYEALEEEKFVCGRDYNLKGIKEKMYVFPLFPLFLFYCSSFHIMTSAELAVAGRGNV